MLLIQTKLPHLKVEKLMKYENLVNELNSLLESAAKKRRKHQKMLKFYLGQLETEEQKLRKKLKKKNNKATRRELKRDLGMVKNAYAILAS